MIRAGSVNFVISETLTETFRKLTRRVMGKVAEVFACVLVWQDHLVHMCVPHRCTGHFPMRSLKIL